MGKLRLRADGKPKSTQMHLSKDAKPRDEFSGGLQGKDWLSGGLSLPKPPRRLATPSPAPVPKAYNQTP
ncbi:MAG: hypothetical protein LBU32_20210 [Clostridiales bacterium]|jgi:hypothetical protein|nr:hypothetical protein [Clostridiales bacterium]